MKTEAEFTESMWNGSDWDHCLYNGKPRFKSCCCLMRSWCEADGPARSLPIPAGRGDVSAHKASRRCSAAGKSSGRGCQPHFTKPLPVLSCFFLHKHKCLTIWNIRKTEDFPPCLPGLWFRCHQGTQRSRFKFLFCMNCSRIFISSLFMPSDFSPMQWESISASSLDQVFIWSYMLLNHNKKVFE